MTEFQKKKFIDLGLIIVGIILVGLFLKTQLSDPIILNVDETNESDLYLVGNYNEDTEDLTNQGIADIKSISLAMDSAYIDVVIELRELPEVLPIQDNAYNWSIYFDVDGDDTENEDIVIEHKNDASFSKGIDVASANDEIFTTTVSRLKKGEIETMGVGESAVEGNMLLIRIPNNGKLEINEKTPYKVILTHQIDQVTQHDELPQGK